MTTTDPATLKAELKAKITAGQMAKMLASINEMDDDTLSRLHYKCVQEVKKINGTVKFEDAVRSGE